MTDQTPEELDALTIWQPMTTAPRDGTWFIAGTAHGTERVVHFADAHDRFPISHDGEAWATAPIKWTPLCTITALRAREAMIEAAAIERAAEASEAVGYLSHEDLRALITPGARTLLDQRIADAEQAGYRRGAMNAKPHFGHPITLQQAARMMLQSHTVQTMVAAGRPLDLVATLTAMSQGDA